MADRRSLMVGKKHLPSAISDQREAHMLVGRRRAGARDRGRCRCYARFPFDAASGPALGRWVYRGKDREGLVFSVDPRKDRDMRQLKLGLNELVSRDTTGRDVSRMMNVKLPLPLLARIGELAAKLRASKTEVVIAILNEGLDTADKELRGWKPPPKPVIPKDRRCSVAACGRERVAKGLCVAHYQAQRRAKG